MARADRSGSVAPPADWADRATAYVRSNGKGFAFVDLLVEGAHCAGCIQRIEGGLRALPGVTEARLNLTTRRLHVAWTEGEAEPPDIIGTIDRLGYRAVAFDAANLSQSKDEQARSLLRALAVAGFAAANVMLLSVAVWAGTFSDMDASTRALMHWVSALIALPAVAYAIRPFARSAIGALKARALNMDVPITLAVILTAAMSLFEAIRGGPHVYFDASVTLLFFLLIGRYLDHDMRRRARSEAEQLLLLRSSTATVIDETGGSRVLATPQIRPGMTVAVAAGERIPVDGMILSGPSDIDTSLITGESVPRGTAAGEAVYAGTINLTAPITVRATAADRDTLLADIIRLTEAAAQDRAHYVRLADRAARVYAPLVHGLALATFLGWVLFGGLAWQPALLIAVSVLIITCPCALGLAVPVVQVVASGRLMRQGILVKSGDGLERLATVDTVIFDKTGTLTLARLELKNVDRIKASDLKLAASIAARSRHPLARALNRAAGTVPVIDDVREEPGLGLEARIGGALIRLGSRAWCGIPDSEPPSTGPEMWLTRPGEPPARFAFEDQLRPDARDVVDRLRSRDLQIELVSGDTRASVAAAAERVGIDRWTAAAKPGDKSARLAVLACKGRRTLMVGDGLNDAPALASAHASMSPAEAADISQTAADLVFQGDRLWPVAEAIDVARRARRLVFQNFALAAGYNALAIPLAVAGFVTPLIAAVAMSASSIVVVLNALRLRLAR